MVNKLIAAAETDTAAETEGAWFQFEPGGGATFRIKLARAGALKGAFQKDLEQRVRPYRQGVKGDGPVIPDNVIREINADLYAKHIVKDWNAEDVGEPYSKEACKAMLLSSSAFMEWCLFTAGAAENFRKAQITDNAGN